MTVFHFKKRDDSGCWEWLNSTDRGYGQAWDSVAQANRQAHRLVWIEFMGPIPDGLTIDHLCHNRACVNPAHMEVVPFEENMRRAVAFKHAGADYCPTGFHPMTPENTTPDGRCRCCRRNYQRDYQRAWNAKRADLLAAS
jgi:hypothetical protein